MLEKLKRKIVYGLTSKPEHYVHIDKPKTLQEKRQVQYNNWCKRYGVYNGSYLPEEPTALLQKGWTDRNPTGGKLGRGKYRRKSSGQNVMFHDDNICDNGMPQDKHYHWFNPKQKIINDKGDENTVYLDRRGKVCKEKSPESHLAPKDKKYNWRNKNEWKKQ